MWVLRRFLINIIMKNSKSLDHAIIQTMHLPFSGMQQGRAYVKLALKAGRAYICFKLALSSLWHEAMGLYSTQEIYKKPYVVEQSHQNTCNTSYMFCEAGGLDDAFRKRLIRQDAWPIQCLICHATQPIMYFSQLNTCHHIDEDDTRDLHTCGCASSSGSSSRTSPTEGGRITSAAMHALSILRSWICQLIWMSSRMHP